MVLGRVQSGVPSVHVALLNVDLGARAAADVVRVAVVVVAVRLQRILAHGDKVQRSVAATAGFRHVRGVLDGLAEEVEPDVVVVVVDLKRLLVGVSKPVIRGPSQTKHIITHNYTKRNNILEGLRNDWRVHPH